MKPLPTALVHAIGVRAGEVVELAINTSHARQAPLTCRVFNEDSGLAAVVYVGPKAQQIQRALDAFINAAVATIVGAETEREIESVEKVQVDRPAEPGRN